MTEDSNKSVGSPTKSTNPSLHNSESLYHESDSTEKNQEQQDQDLTQDAESKQEQEPITDEPKYITGRTLHLISAGLLLSIFIVQMEASIVSTAVISITDDLGAYEKSSWIFTAYFAAYCGLQMIWAKTSDITGRKPAIILALIIFTIFSGLCGAAQTMIQLIMFRWCQGAGGCGVFALACLMFFELVPARLWPTYTTIVNLCISVSTIVGPLLGGGIAKGGGGKWRWIFLINLPIGAISVLALWLTLPARLWNEPAARNLSLALAPTFSRKTFRRVDLLGSVLLLGASILLATGLQQAALGFGWTSTKVLPLLLTAFPLALAFFLWQWYITTRRTHPEPVFPWRFCTNRKAMGMIVNSFLVGMNLYTGVTQLPQRFITVNGLSPLAAAIRMLSFGAMVPFGSAVAGALMGGRARIPPCWVILSGALLQIVGAVLLARIPATPHIEPGQYGFQLVLGTGVGFVIAGLILLVPYHMEKRDLATASASTAQFRVLGGLVGIAIATSITTPYIRHHLLFDHASPVPPAMAARLLEKTEAIRELEQETRELVARVFAEGFGLQSWMMVALAGAQVPVTGWMWSGVRAGG